MQNFIKSIQFWKRRGNSMNLLQKQTLEALKKWRKLVYNYENNEIYLDDLERVVTLNMSNFQAQISTINSINNAESSTFFLHGDLLVNNLLVELADTDQIHFYLYAEINSFDKSNEVLSVFYVASGFESQDIQSGEGSDSTKVLKAIELMKKWCRHASDEPKFKTMILNRLIDRLFHQHQVKVAPGYAIANLHANNIVYNGSEKLRDS